jgi:hypothetical protein
VLVKGARKMAGIPISLVLKRKIPPVDITADEYGELNDGFNEDVDLIKNVESEFIESADDILKMLNLSHLRVKTENEG